MGRGRPARDEIYKRLDAQISELWNQLGGLPSPLEASDIWTDIWTAEAHHSTALEGNTLVISEVEQLLKEGRAVGAKQLKEYLEVQGYAAASTWVYREGSWRKDGPTQDSLYQSDGVISINEVRHIHQLAMQPVWDVAPHPDATDYEGPGSFRQHEIQQFHGGMKPPTWPTIDSRMAAWREDALTIGARTPEFTERIARSHCHFEQIHPFLDGNGRTGRLVMNLMLVRFGYPPVIIFKNDRERYLKALRRADKGDYGAMGEFLARAILDNLYRFIVPAVAGPAKLVPLGALATNEISHTTLRTAANRGTLQATRGADGQWRSSRKWVDDYLRNRYKRR
ncbi:Fic family protein [Nocardia amamiensis]|uniref:Fic family protein n=1 Tax=Nocardia amamiensis TaxID=404578 RepID=A0ABS0CZA9_9NOCA|nr:Fic family protein [Nocardia amamiensis]MBF6301188.1 Fic family protein [Nocardia amamiensis]